MTIVNPSQLRQSFLDHFANAGSVNVPPGRLVPENDSTTLFTGSGMQPMVPYLLGEPHPIGNDISNIQPCIRTGDIDEVGDETHLTYFEMVGRWEFGADVASYKKKQIHLVWDWMVNKVGLDPSRLYVSVFIGNKELGIPQDDESILIWKDLFSSVGLEATVEDDPDQYGASRGARIFLYGESENWWSRVGAPAQMPVGEPGGADSEMFYCFDPDGDPYDHPATDGSRFLEIGNNVFMSHVRTEAGFDPLQKPNIDYGGGLERVSCALNNNRDVYLSPFFATAMKKMEEISGLEYADHKREFRIILDHIRAASFLIGDGVIPSNTDAGYVCRRLIRRAIRTIRRLKIEDSLIPLLSEIFISDAGSESRVYKQREQIVAQLIEEENRFKKTLETGEREILKFYEKNKSVTGADAFRFYETYGFPLEVTKEVLQEIGAAVEAPEQFETAAEAHSEKSKAASSGRFKGGLADNSEITTALHTATHLMLAGLQKVLGPDVHQKGSNITPERARFDFNHPEKVTKEQLQLVEEYVNQAIASKAPLEVLQMQKDEAKAANVEGSFWEKYPETVKVYHFSDDTGTTWSKELCGGPHVENTGDLAKFGTFKILKEQSSGAGVRRVKAAFKE